MMRQPDPGSLWQSPEQQGFLMEKETMNLKKNMEGYMGQFGGREEKGRRKCNYIKSQSKKRVNIPVQVFQKVLTGIIDIKISNNKDKNIGPNRCLTL